MMNLGDFTTSETIYVPFTTYDSNGASVTITGLAVTDIEIYKDGSVTQRSSDAGYTLLDTDGIDFDSTTGLHGFSVDLSDNTDAGFYAAGSQYWLVVNAITVDSQTVVFCYYFTIGRYLKPTTAGRTLDVTATGAAGIDWGNVENPTTAVDLSGTDIQLCDTVTTNTDMRGTDNAATAAAMTTAQNDLDIITGAAGVLIDQGTGAGQLSFSSGILNVNATQFSGSGTAADNAEIVFATDFATNYNTTRDAWVTNAQDFVGTTGADPFSGTVVAASVTGNVGGSVGSLGATAKSDVNAEVVDALATDTYAEPAQGTPGATITLAAKIGFLYKAWRNKFTTTSSEYDLYNDDAATVDHKATLADDGTTYTKGEVTSGP